MSVAGARAVAGPSRPHSALREGGVAWRLINLLSLNYLSLLDAGDGGDAAAALRDLLGRVPMGNEPAQRRLVESIQRPGGNVSGFTSYAPTHRTRW